MVSGKHLTPKHLTTICSFTGPAEKFHKPEHVRTHVHLSLESVVRCLNGITAVNLTISLRWTCNVWEWWGKDWIS